MPYRDAHELARENEELRSEVAKLLQERGRLTEELRVVNERAQGVHDLCRDMIRELNELRANCGRHAMVFWVLGVAVVAQSILLSIW